MAAAAPSQLSDLAFVAKISDVLGASENAVRILISLILGKLYEMLFLE